MSSRGDIPPSIQRKSDSGIPLAKKLSATPLARTFAPLTGHSVNSLISLLVGEVGLEPTKAKPTDLQSVPFAARDTPPFLGSRPRTKTPRETRGVIRLSYPAPRVHLSTG